MAWKWLFLSLEYAARTHLATRESERLGRIRLIDDPFVAYLFQISLFTSIASPYLVEKDVILERILKKNPLNPFRSAQQTESRWTVVGKKLVPFPDNAARRYVSSVKAREMRLFRYFSYQRQTSLLLHVQNLSEPSRFVISLST